MKTMFTKVLAAAAIMSVGTTLSAQAIWGHGASVGVNDGEFAGGLNGWTTAGVSDPDAVWIWNATGQATQGAFGGGANATAIASASVSNGAAVFDSDFYDNAGSQTGFGLGVAPAPNSGYIQSPIIDCSGTPAVSVTFNNLHRNFDALTYLVASADGGVTWPDTAYVNDGLSDIIVASNAQVNDVRTYRLPSCGGSANVMVRFVFDFASATSQSYYYWVIDDVAIIPTPAVDNRMAAGYYGVATNFQTPVTQVENIVWAADGLAHGTDGAVTMNLAITSPGAANNYNESVGVGRSNLNGTYLEFFMPNPYALSAIEGTYDGIWTINPTANDVNVADNSKAIQFKVSSNVFAKDNGVFTSTGGTVNTGLSNGGDPYKIGNHYHITTGGYAVENVQIALANITGSGNCRNTSVIVGIYQWDDADGDGSFTDDSELTKVGEGEYLVPATGGSNNAFINVPVTAFPALSGSVVLPAGEYIVTAECDGVARISRCTRINYSAMVGESRNQGNTRLATVIYDGGAAARWFSAGFGYDQVAGIRLQLSTNPDAVNTLANDAVSVRFLPNPVKDVLNVELNFAAATEKVTYEISDLTGKVLFSTTRQNVQSEVFTQSVSNLPAGKYNFTIRTNGGIRTEGFVVIK